MKSSFLFKAKSDNYYFFDEFHNKILFFHPIMVWLYKLYLNNPNGSLNFNKNDQVMIPNYGIVSYNEIDYYIKKLLFLKEKNFFSNMCYSHRLIADIKKETVEYSLANSKIIVFEVTDLCNLKCSYCAFGDLYEQFDQREGKTLDVKDGITLIDYLRKYWESDLNQSINSSISICFYGGEPLLNIDFIKQIIKYTKEISNKRYSFKYVITTNATLLNKYIDYLVANDFLISISLDGDEASNCYRRYQNGASSYKKVLKNIELIQLKYPDFFRKNISFLSVLHSRNSVIGICNFFSHHFNQIPLISELAKIDINHSTEEKFSKIFKDYSKEINHELKSSSYYKTYYFQFPEGDLLGIFVDRFTGFAVKDYQKLMFDCKEKFIPTGTCLPFSKKIFLTVNGKILPCEKVGTQFALGNIADGNINLDFHKVAIKYSKYFKRILKSCKTCSTNRFCHRCVFHMDIEDGKTTCPDIMTIDKIELLAGDIMSILEDSPSLYCRALEETNYN